jgi:hypothetical protein
MVWNAWVLIDGGGRGRLAVKAGNHRIMRKKVSKYLLDKRENSCIIISK